MTKIPTHWKYECCDKNFQNSIFDSLILISPDFCSGAEAVPFADVILFSGYSGWLETRPLLPLSSTGFTVADFVELERHARFRFIVRGKVRDVRGQRILEADSYRLFRKSTSRCSLCMATNRIRTFRNKIDNTIL